MNLPEVRSSEGCLCLAHEAFDRAGWWAGPLALLTALPPHHPGILGLTWHSNTKLDPPTRLDSRSPTRRLSDSQYVAQVPCPLGPVRPRGRRPMLRRRRRPGAYVGRLVHRRRHAEDCLPPALGRGPSACGQAHGPCPSAWGLSPKPPPPSPAPAAKVGDRLGARGRSHELGFGSGEGRLGPGLEAEPRGWRWAEEGCQAGAPRCCGPRLTAGPSRLCPARDGA